MKWISSTFWVLITFLIASCAQQTPQSSQLYNRDHQPITFDAMLADLAQVDYILLGEVHDNALHHQAEVKLFNALSAQPNRLAIVVLEMLPSAQNAQLTHAQHHIRADRITDSECIACLLGWDEKWDWAQYRALVTDIARSPTALLGGNLTREEINTVMQGAYPLNGTRSTTAEVKAQIAKMITQSHGKLDDATLANLVSVQQFKDRRMAQTLVEATPNHQRGLLIAGRFHTSRFFGVPVHLDDYQKRRYATVIMTDDRQRVRAGEADYIWEIR
ncbi:ChaN family lipoprotein [Pasteurellaceae bacterium TAE3-ERU1]|nr:ChaN family lipoprotein [Pasteurellaceae bacterium TAE3-ERU1]